MSSGVAASQIEKWEIVNLLCSLGDKSLLITEPSEDGFRYRLLETVRQHCREELRKEDEVPWARKHFDHFSAMVRNAEPQFTGPNAIACFDDLDKEHDNLRSALEFASVHVPDAGLEMAASLWRFWYVRGHMAEGRSWLEKFLSVSSHSNTSDRAKAFHGLGVLSMVQGDRERAVKNYNASLAIKRELNDEAGIAYSLSALGAAADEVGDFQSAREQYEESLAIFRRLGLQHGITIAVINLGRTVSHQGDYEAACPLLEESIRIARTSGDLRNLALALNNLASIDVEDGRADAAEIGATQSKALFEQIGDPWGVALTLTTLGRMHQVRGDLEKAYEITKQSLEQLERAGDARQSAEQYVRLGSVRFDQGDLSSARDLCRTGIAAFVEISDRWALANALSLFGCIRASEDPSLAAFSWGACERLREDIGAPLLKSARASYEKSVALAREKLGAAEFDSSWRRGRDADFDDVLAAVLAM